MFHVVTVREWREVWDLGNKLMDRGWIFRGQRCVRWGLESCLERGARLAGCPRGLLRNRENCMLRDFQNRAHEFLTSVPDENDVLMWLSLIQHHGGPTRLLDFTYSFPVATFFAFDIADDAVAI